MLSCIWSDKRMKAAIIIFLSALWLIGYKAVFIAEWNSLRAAPSFMKMSSADKSLLVWGTRYRPFMDGLSVTPEKSSIYFLNYCPETKGGWQWLLAKYYLAPRQIVFSDPGDTNRETALKSDFVIACVCSEMSGTGVENLSFLEQPPFKKVISNAYQPGNYAIYRIEKTMEGIK